MWKRGWTWPPIILLLHQSAPQESFYLPVCLLSQVNDAESTVGVEFTPTIPHCSMATLIGLSIKVKLLRSLPDRFKVRMCISVCVCVCVCVCVGFRDAPLTSPWLLVTTCSTSCNILMFCCLNFVCFSVSTQIDVHITPGTHASEEAGNEKHQVKVVRRCCDCMWCNSSLCLCLCSE